MRGDSDCVGIIMSLIVVGILWLIAVVKSVVINVDGADLCWDCDIRWIWHGMGSKVVWLIVQNIHIMLVPNYTKLCNSQNWELVLAFCFCCPRAGISRVKNVLILGIVPRLESILPRFLEFCHRKVMWTCYQRVYEGLSLCIRVWFCVYK